MLSENHFVQELVEFVGFFYAYLRSRVLSLGVRFEKIKDIIVAVLVVKRGKYSQSFLNTSFFLLVATVFIGGPAIAENNPFIAQYFTNRDAPTQNILATDIEALPIDTTISQKPRDTIIEYEIKSGDTLGSIADKFQVSIDTIKWANNLKTNIIKPGQTLKIPPVTGVVYKVVSGDNIYSIAKKYKTDAQNIVNFPFNDFEDLETFALRSGQILYVPDGVIEEAVPIRRPVIADITGGAPGSGNFIWPASGSISQYPIWYHMALDIANKALPPVLAADSGTVTQAGCGAGGYGCNIIVNHNNGFETLYAHLSQIGVSVGQVVGKGQTIGRVGSTGRSTGPHLHFEVRSGGRLMNPLNFLK